MLGRRLGKVDVFSYRHLIGLSSAELSRAFPPFEDPLDVVVTALSATTGRWKDTYTSDEYARARRLMEDFGIAYLAGKQFGRLSEGERTRTLICRALMAQSELLILDEPTTGLDLGAREITIRALSSLHDDPRTIIVVTHHLEEIPQGFDHIAIMGRQSTVTSQPDPADPAPGTIEYAGDLEHGLTAERLSRLFGMPLDVHHIDDRWSAFAPNMSMSATGRPTDGVDELGYSGFTSNEQAEHGVESVCAEVRCNPVRKCSSPTASRTRSPTNWLRAASHRPHMASSCMTM